MLHRGIPPSMIINCDETETKMVPVRLWTMEIQGTKQIDMIAMDDKRENSPTRSGSVW